MPTPHDDPNLRTARREAIIVALAWLVAAGYTLTYCGLFAYGRDPAKLTLVFGFPDWVFYGLLLPWAACVAFSFWFAYLFMADADLGVEAEDMTPGGSREMKHELD